MLPNIQRKTQRISLRSESHQMNLARIIGRGNLVKVMVNQGNLDKVQGQGLVTGSWQVFFDVFFPIFISTLRFQLTVLFSGGFHEYGQL